jgi:hypothetical protein
MRVAVRCPASSAGRAMVSCASVVPRGWRGLACLPSGRGGDAKSTSSAIARPRACRSGDARPLTCVAAAAGALWSCAALTDGRVLGGLGILEGGKRPDGGMVSAAWLPALRGWGPIVPRSTPGVVVPPAAVVALAPMEPALALMLRDVKLAALPVVDAEAARADRGDAPRLKVAEAGRAMPVLSLSALLPVPSAAVLGWGLGGCARAGDTRRPSHAASMGDRGACRQLPGSLRSVSDRSFVCEVADASATAAGADSPLSPAPPATSPALWVGSCRTARSHARSAGVPSTALLPGTALLGAVANACGAGASQPWVCMSRRADALRARAARAAAKTPGSLMRCTSSAGGGGGGGVGMRGGVGGADCTGDSTGRLAYTAAGNGLGGEGPITTCASGAFSCAATARSGVRSCRRTTACPTTRSGVRDAPAPPAAATGASGRTGT